MIMWPLQSQARQFFGNPSINTSHWEKEFLVDVPCPWTLVMDGEKLNKIRINKMCAASLSRVLNNVWDAVDKEQSAIETLHYHRYSGSFNYRPMRGGSSLSMHAYGAAIDWDDGENEQHSHKHILQDSSLLIVKFKEEGWSWGGDWSGSTIDAMHVQAARVHGKRATLSAIHDPWPPHHAEIKPAGEPVLQANTGDAVVVQANNGVSPIPVIWTTSTQTSNVIPVLTTNTSSSNVSPWWANFWS